MSKNISCSIGLILTLSVLMLSSLTVNASETAKVDNGAKTMRESITEKKEYGRLTLVESGDVFDIYKDRLYRYNFNKRGKLCARYYIGVSKRVNKLSKKRAVELANRTIKKYYSNFKQQDYIQSIEKTGAQSPYWSIKYDRVTKSGAITGYFDCQIDDTGILYAFSIVMNDDYLESDMVNKIISKEASSRIAVDAIKKYLVDLKAQSPSSFNYDLGDLAGIEILESKLMALEGKIPVWKFDIGVPVKNTVDYLRIFWVDVNALSGEIIRIMPTR